MKIHIINVVWGEEYVKTFLDISLFFQLTPNNLKAFKKLEFSYKIYTTKKDKEVIKTEVPFFYKPKL